MWVLTQAPFSAQDSRINMFENGIKEATSYGWMDLKMGEYVLTTRGEIARTVCVTKYGTTENDLKATAMKEHLRGHGQHPGPNAGFQTWTFPNLVKFMGFYAAMAKAIEYNTTIEKTLCGQEFLLFFKTHYKFSTEDSEIIVPARGDKVGISESGEHYRTWEIRQESLNRSLPNGLITKEMLII